MDIISPSVSPKVINNTRTLLPSAGSATLTNGSGTATGSPITLNLGANTVAITGAGSFTVVLPAGFSGVAASSTAAVTGNPVALVAGTQTINVVGIGNIIVTIGFDTDLVSIPKIQTGYTYRLTASNPTGATANLMVKDVYTPDSSVGNPTPTLVVKNRYPMAIIATDWIDVNGHKISKHMGLLRVTSDTVGVILGYLLQLE
jgi:hypothetical protein